MNRGPTLGVEMIWLIAVFAVGVIGLVAMVFLLFGFLGYWGVFAFPFVFLAELAFAFVQWSPAYFGVVLMGLAAGITVATLLPRTQAQR